MANYNFPGQFLDDMISKAQRAAVGQKGIIQVPIKMGPKEFNISVNADAIKKLTPQMMTQLLNQGMAGLPPKPPAPSGQEAVTNALVGEAPRTASVKQNKSSIGYNNLAKLIEDILNKRGSTAKEAVRTAQP